MPKRKTNKSQKRSNAKSKKKEDQKSKMTMSMQIALIAGGIAFAIAGYLISFGHHKISSIWLLFAGVVLSSLGGALYLHAQALPDLAPQDSIPTPSVPDSTPTTPAMSNQPINISSINQSGGITAHTVSISNTPAKRGILESAVPIFTSALGTSPRGVAKVEQHGMDSETTEFAGQVLTLMRMAGFTAEPPINVTISPDIRPGILIGTANPGDPSGAATAVSRAFKAIGIETLFAPAPSDDPLTIIVGPKP